MSGITDDNEWMTPWRKGVMDYENGVSIYEPPYLHGSADYYRWVDGWKTAQKDRENKQKPLFLIRHKYL